MDTSRFEADRLALFAAHGFHGESRRTSDSDGNETYMLVGGEGSPTRVLVHGGLSEAASWAMLAGRLQGRLAIPDRPGYGLSYSIDYRKVDDYFEAAAGWLESVVEGLGEETVDLVGTSMGGFFTTAFAVLHPERVRRLVLLGAPAGIERSIPVFLRLWGNPITGRLFLGSKMENPEQLRERAYSSLVVHPDRVPIDQLQVEFTAGLLPTFGFTTHTMLRAATNLRGWRSRYIIRDHLLGLNTPTLIAWGAKDTNFSQPALGQGIASEMPNGTFRLIPDAGHAPWIDQPDLTAETLNNYLNEA